MRVDELEIDPALSPGVLDTATWDRAAAWSAIQAVEDAYWPALVEAAAAAPLPATEGLMPHVAAGSQQAGMDVARGAVENVAAVLNGRWPPRENVVNRGVVPRIPLEEA